MEFTEIFSLYLLLTTSLKKKIRNKQKENNQYTLKKKTLDIVITISYQIQTV